MSSLLLDRFFKVSIAKSILIKTLNNFPSKLLYFISLLTELNGSASPNKFNVLVPLEAHHSAPSSSSLRDRGEKKEFWMDSFAE